MTDSPNRGGDEQPGFRDGPAPTQPLGDTYPGYTDPAYASQTPYGSAYQPPAPTDHLPAYSPYGYDPYAAGEYGQYQYGGQYPPTGPEEPPPDEPKSPRWLWVLATTAVLAVIGLVIALVIVYDNSSRRETVVAPPPSLPEPASPTRAPTTTSRTPSIPVFPVPTLPSVPPTTSSTAPRPTETVVYTVSGNGRAINITYVDNGGLLQTEFNVLLPWSKEVQLPKPANGSASISIINVGREVNCSISVNGVTVEQRTGAGLTICTAG